MMMQHLGSFFLILFVAFSASAQDTRTVDTRIADALALLPAKDSEIANIACNELMSLDDDGLGKVLDGVRPNGDLTGVPYRYAVSLVATKAVKPVDRARIENALINALRRSKETEVRQYFISYLALIGTNRSASTLTAIMVSDQTLADPATGALLSIAGTRAATDLQPAPQGTVTVTANQEHLRIAELRELVIREPTSSQPLLVKELDRFDAGYRRDVLNVAATQASNPTVWDAWIKEYKRSKGERQADIFSMLARSNNTERFVKDFTIPALESKNPLVRMEAIRALATTGNRNYAYSLSALILDGKQLPDERAEVLRTFMQIADLEDIEGLVQRLSTAKSNVKVTILGILAARQYRLSQADVLLQTSSPEPVVRAAAFAALPGVASPNSVPKLLTLLQQAQDSTEIKALQKALVVAVNPIWKMNKMTFQRNDNGRYTYKLIDTTDVALERTKRYDDEYDQAIKAIKQEAAIHKINLLPIVPFLYDDSALPLVTASLGSASPQEQEVAFAALLDWPTGAACGELVQLLHDKSKVNWRNRAFSAYVRNVMHTNWSADLKLLKLREVFALATTVDEHKLILREAGSIRTFLSFVFVSSWMDDPELGATASRSAMRLALPTADGQAGMEGQEVRRALEKVMDRLTGPDTQYDRIDVQTYLDQLPYTQGFEPIFNGKDLTGWQGLVENPIARSKMTKEELAAKQAVSDAKLSESWSVKDGMICFTGTGDNLCTNRLYGDFELIVDWKISRNGDSGIYLRGSPQVQIWDTSRVDVGAQVGSGGLYNNTVNRNPLVVADNPIGDWNTLRITMIGERVTVYLNGSLVVDNVVMENYWDRKIPIFPEGPIELQAHGTELAFRNVYVRELNRPYQLSAEEKQKGYDLLFNSKDLSGWVGNKTDYVVDDQVIVINPTGRGKGNLYTEKEYSDFVFRFEFQLTPAGNNGLGIHAPLEGDAAYVGKEIQILDDRHVAYKDIQPWQVHGSVYGVIAAKRDALRPTGQWNEEEVEVHGDRIKVTVNGVVIVDGDMKKASANGTLDGKVHPGLNRHTGHIGFLGHGSVVRFRNIRIKDLLKK